MCEEKDEYEGGHYALGGGGDGPAPLERRFSLVNWKKTLLKFYIYLRIVEKRRLLVSEILPEYPTYPVNQPGHAHGVHGKVDEAALPKKKFPKYVLKEKCC